MKRISPADTGRGFMLLLTVCILGAAFYINRTCPESVICGEESVGTWLSLFLLSSAATVSLCIAMRQRQAMWWLLASFLTVLALDERFMFHEQIKQYIILSSRSPKSVPMLLAELPVLAAGLLGVAAAVITVRRMSHSGRYFIIFAALLGACSIVLDVLNVWLIIEDSCKIAAELLLVLGLIGEFGNINYT
jgi:hypothetical protein